MWSRSWAFFSLLFFLTVSGSGVMAAPSPSSSIVWQKTVGGSADDAAYSMDLTPDGGWVVAGVTNSPDGDCKTNHGRRDGLLVKFDSAGTVQWTKCYGNAEDDGFTSVVVTADGGYIAAGYTNLSRASGTRYHGGSDLWVVKISSTGSVQWEQCYGGNGEDMAGTIRQTPTGDYLVMGTTTSLNNGDVKGLLGESDAWLIRISQTGTLSWQKCLGGPGEDLGYGLWLDSDNGFLVTGRIDVAPSTASPTWGFGDVLAAKLDASGTVSWLQHYGGLDEDIGHSIRRLSDGRVLITGFTRSARGNVSGWHGGSDAWVLQITGDTGNLVTQKCLGGWNDEAIFQFLPLDDGDFLLIGQAESFNGDVSGNHGDSDLWLVQLDGIYNRRWQKCLGGRGIDAGHAVRILPDGTMLLAGFGSPRGEGDIADGKTGTDLWVMKVQP